MLSLQLEIGSGDVIIVDDMVDSAGTVQILSQRLKKAGAKDIYLAASHGLFAEKSIEVIENSPVSKVLVTDTLPMPKNPSSKIHQLSVAKFLADVILTEHFRSASFDDDVFEEDN